MIFYISRNVVKTISVHFVSTCNTIRAIVKYFNYAISYTFPCEFMPYFRCYKFFVVLSRIGMYVRVLCEGHISSEEYLLWISW